MGYPTNYVKAGTPPSSGPTPGARALLAAVLTVEPFAFNLGIYNPRDVCGNPWPDFACAPSQHATGLAVDFGIPVSLRRWLGDRLAALLVTNAPEIGVTEVIWHERRWTAAGGWRPYSGRSPHHDHVHVTIHPEAGRRLTEAEARAALSGAPQTSQAEVIADFSYAKPTADQVVTAGLGGVVGYVSNTAAKNLPKPLIDGLLVRGKTVNLVWQEGKSGPLGGVAQGVADAKEANRQADALGAPDWLPIVYAVDFDATAVQLSVVGDYFRAVQATSKRPVGAYGGLRTIDYLAPVVPGLALFWQSKAWSDGRVSIHSHLLQEVGAPFRPIPGVATDDNTVLKPFPRWGRTTTIAFGPITVHDYPEDQMRRFDMTMPLDDQGCGWRDVPTDRDPEDVVSIVVNAADPPGNGYRSITASRLGVDGKTRVVVTGGPPRGEVGLDVWVADG